SPTSGNVLLGNSESAQIVQWEINSSFAEIHRDVLPKVSQLKRRTGEIRELLAFRVTVAAGIEHKMTNRVCGILAISQQIFEALISRSSLVLPEGLQQICEWSFGYVAGPDCLCKSD